MQDEGEGAASNVRLKLAGLQAAIWDDAKPDEVQLATSELQIVIGEPPELPDLTPERNVTEANREKERIATLEAEKADLSRQLGTALSLVKKLTTQLNNKAASAN